MVRCARDGCGQAWTMTCHGGCASVTVCMLLHTCRSPPGLLPPTRGLAQPQHAPLLGASNMDGSIWNDTQLVGTGIRYV